MYRLLILVEYLTQNMQITAEDKDNFICLLGEICRLSNKNLVETIKERITSSNIETEILLLTNFLECIQTKNYNPKRSRL